MPDVLAGSEARPYRREIPALTPKRSSRRLAYYLDSSEACAYYKVQSSYLIKIDKLLLSLGVALMVDFKSIETFLWVVTLGGFRAAGEKLNTTQPAISQRIAQLERELGVKLLNRDHRVASPTPSGRQLMVYAEKLIGLRSGMMAEGSDRSAMRGVLRPGRPATHVHPWLSLWTTR